MTRETASVSWQSRWWMKCRGPEMPGNKALTCPRLNSIQNSMSQFKNIFKTCHLPASYSCHAAAAAWAALLFRTAFLVSCSNRQDMTNAHQDSRCLGTSTSPGTVHFKSASAECPLSEMLGGKNGLIFQICLDFEIFL